MSANWTASASAPSSSRSRSIFGAPTTTSEGSPALHALADERRDALDELVVARVEERLVPERALVVVGVARRFHRRSSSPGRPRSKRRDCRNRSAAGIARRVSALAAVVVAESLTKRFGKLTAVDDLSFALDAGHGHRLPRPERRRQDDDAADAARPRDADERTRARVRRSRTRELERPALRVGAVLEATDFHPGRSGPQPPAHARAAPTGVPDSRVDEVLRLVELDGAANRRVKGYSLGMRQRLGLAAALLGDPELLILDEPANGLDPEGVRWLRDFLRAFAAGGRTVLVSSHVLAEVAQTVDQRPDHQPRPARHRVAARRADRARRRRGARPQPAGGRAARGARARGDRGDRRPTASLLVARHDERAGRRDRGRAAGIVAARARQRGVLARGGLPRADVGAGDP